ncbi:MAG: DUF58 domain-containing protein [Prolixibacteraceae bacterium]|jgi:uncharacterized protein (DUF58 family)|nr:DUF58 domain-containing protein [Bacteroidota bacterium]NLT00506.1 DUF58 domain-containing protein [Bacteroidales bacterium]OQB80983.1 MAG: hypothetical protein BWX87_00996 [Bacteroidetes bacterium ADurb.Bin123]HNZ68903.1 DUF58 domain-containing protein [Prolixibacteraceae bacterium]HOC85796.1 DUF58 domain-containing protein [Prolixibacteraceae bacterium]
METTDLLKRVRQIEIKTRGLTRNIFAGEYHSAFKGRGMAFSEVREYQFGDDIRNIDWNVTARYSHPYVKIFEEERELTVMLLIDVSGSREFGTFRKLKKNIITEVGAILAFSAIQNNDKTGVIFFSDTIEKFIPPKKGKTHILRIIREMIEFTPQNRGTNIPEALRYLTNAIKKKCTVFVISDFLDNHPDLEQALSVANNKHDVVAIRIYDNREEELPPIGMMKLKDAETGQYTWVNSNDETTRRIYRDGWRNRTAQLKAVFTRCGVDSAWINTREDYVRSLMNLFKKRGARR